MTNPNDPVELLLDEHVVILAQADELRQAMDRLAKAGPSGLEAERETLGSFARLLAGKLALHALKEDDALFPAVEAHIGTDGPTAVMREEHKEIHQRGVEYRALLKELHEVDHPEIEAQSEAYQEMVEGMASGDIPDLDTMQANVNTLLDLMHVHFEKEEQVLFPMTYNVLDKDALAEVAQKFRDLEAQQS
jgi:hemerythrin-like domain-containing protein